MAYAAAMRRLTLQRVCSRFVCAGIALLLGCSAGEVQLIALDYDHIDPPSPQPVKLALDACAFDVQPDGGVRIIMERRAPLWPREIGEFTWLGVVRLPALPAGAARNYTLTPGALSVRLNAGPMASELDVIRGVLALYRESSTSYRGSLRALMSRRNQGLLGWSAAPPQVLLATFTAVRDADRVARTLGADEGAAPALSAR